MKYLIRGIGGLTAVFALFFFLLVADKLYYQNDTTTYDISLDRRLTGGEVQAIAKSAGVTFRITYYHNTNFGRHDLEMAFINPEHIKEGKQDSIFPASNIIHSVFDVNSDIKLQYFTLMSGNESDAGKVAELFALQGVKADMMRNEPIQFHVGMLFSSLNLSFFLFLTVLMFLSIASYYVQRLKEIGVRKLNGWTGLGITCRLIAPLMAQIYIAFFAVLIPVGCYVLYKDTGMIKTFLALILLICLFMALVFLIAALGGLYFIRKIDRVGAIKNHRNSRLISRILLFFKAAVTVMLIFSMSAALAETRSLQAANTAIDKLKQYNFYKLSTPVVPEESVMEQINHIIGTFGDSDIFNYTVSSAAYSAEKLKTAVLKTADELIEKDQMCFTVISANMLSVIKVQDENGQTVHPADFKEDEAALLIPAHFQNELPEILSYFDVSNDIRILFLQDGQTQNILTRPGYYTFDSIYSIQPLQKLLYLNQGDVLLTENCAKQLQQKLLSVDTDGASVRIESQNMEYGIFQGNISLALCESLFRVVINFASFALCASAAAIIFLELRKKEFGVYRLLGRYPMKAMIRFAGINLISTFLSAIIVWPGFLWVVLLEGVLYCSLMSSYLRQKAVLVLKGA